MNLAKLFEMQRELGKVGLFAYKGEDRFNKLVLALLVELGECANEWRGFKFWSKDQEPKRYEEEFNLKTNRFRSFDPLLEEYVDGFHFVLELGIELQINIDYLEESIIHKPSYREARTTTDQFNAVFALAAKPIGQYGRLFCSFMELGEMLGFTWDQIEQAYLEKNKVNHQRQEQGY